jgi:hypothetical protein
MSSDYTDNYRRLRNVLELTNDRVAVLLGVDAGSVDRWERCEEAPPHGFVAALQRAAEQLPRAERVRDELATVGKLVTDTKEQIGKLSSFSTRDVVFNRAANQPVDDHNKRSVADLKLLLHQAYGRVVRLEDSDSGEERIIRVAWGARSAPNQSVYSRNSPVIQRLMSVRPGDTVEMLRLGSVREYDVVEVSILDRHSVELVHQNLDNFARLELRQGGRVQPSEVIGLREWFKRFQVEYRDDLLTGTYNEPERGHVAVTPESQSALSDRFFMSPLETQEDAMRWPATGHVLVEGVAGSGKTSVALGRSALVCMPTHEDGEVELSVHKPETGVGFVLSEQLVGYLQQMLKSDRLGLSAMPVRSYFMLRQQLISQRMLLKKVRRVGADRPSDDYVAGTAAWLACVEERMPARIGDVLLAKLPADPRKIGSSGVSERHWEALDKHWNRLRAELPRAFSRLDRLVERVDSIRAELARTLEHLEPWNRPVHREARRKVSETIRNAIVDAFAFAPRYREVLLSRDFGSAVRDRIASDGYGLPTRRVEASLAAARKRARARPQRLSNEDIDCLLVIAHRASVGYSGRGGTALPIEHLRETSYRTHVFIDEVQDFSEVQVLLMAAQADPKYRCVTAVGDFAQQLSRGGIASASRSMLAVENTVFLAHDKRQSAPLHAFSQEIRSIVCGDERESIGEPPRTRDEQPILLGAGRTKVRCALAEELAATRRDHPDYTMAVICASASFAKALESALHDELWEQDILSRVSGAEHAAKLCDAYHVHFTTPLEAKGLEFDAVFVPDVDAFRLNDPPHQSALYVAVSRARRLLGIGWTKSLAEPLASIVGKHVMTTRPE